MTHATLHQTIHGYKRGHQILAKSGELSKSDLDELSRLSDLSGSLVDATFEPYLTLYPLPSRNWYCLAKTWRDENAPRDGCVLTHSILVPMSTWLAGISATEIANQFRKPQQSQYDKYEKPLDLEWSKNSNNRLTSLIDERWFIDQATDFSVLFYQMEREPLLWSIKDQHLASPLLLNIVDLLWRNTRRDFSICGYALQSKSTHERVFDVMLIPAKAVGRFSKFPRENFLDSLEGEADLAAFRNQPAIIELTKAVLGKSQHVSALLTEAGDSLPSSRSSIIKLLRIRELESAEIQNNSSPIAILDLWTALAPNAESAVDAKSRAIASAIQRSEAMPTDEALDALVSIAQRAHRSAMSVARDSSPDLNKKLRDAVAHIPSKAVELLAARKVPPKELVAATASVLAEPNRIDADIAKKLPTIPDGTGRRMLAHAPMLASTIIGLSGLNTNRIADLLLRWLGDANSNSAKKALCSLADNPELIGQESLLRAVIGAANPKTVPLVLRAAQMAPTHPASTNALLTTFAHKFSDSARDHFIAQGLVTEQDVPIALASIRTLADVIQIADITTKIHESKNTTKFLEEYVENRVDPLSTDDANELFKRLSELKNPDDTILAKISSAISVSEIPHPASIPHTLRATRSVIAERWFDRQLAYRFVGELEDEPFAAAVKTVHGIEPFQQNKVYGTVQKIVSNTSHEKPLLAWRTLRIFWSITLRKGDGRALGFIDDLFRATRVQFNEAMAGEWASILDDTKKLSRSYWSDLCIQSLRIAMAEPDLPMGIVVGSAFPAFYAKLPTGRKSNRFLDPFGLFDQVDKKKDAPKELVRSFRSSSWSPAFLAVAASNAGVLKKVLKVVAHTGGSHALSLIRDDLDRRSLTEIRKEFGRVSRNLV